jgi:ketosteroid isomerase-like protein
MVTNRELIDAFYTAFAHFKAEEMVNCYHNDIRFEDPVFGVLQGDQARNMWRMLVRPGIVVTHDQVAVSGDTGSANWTATYAFGTTGKKVVNNVSAHFVFKDGKIIQHTDHFNMRTWARQALGFKGFLLGGTSFLRNKIRQQALTRLDNFTKQRAGQL